MGTIRAAVAIGVAGALASLSGPALAADVIPATGAPTLGPENVVPSDFSARVTNPWFPLRRGSVYRYQGTKDGAPVVEITRVTRRTKMIMGVPAVAVRDRLFAHGKVVEDTVDWYTQDKKGNVWYLGEATATYENGKVVSRSGSFQAGVNGARGGIFMPARPRVGQEFQQELFKGQAEDRFRVASLSATAAVPFVTTSRALRTTEWTPLEPKVVDAKLYVRGVGLVGERQLRGPGPREQLELVAYTRG